MQIASEANKIQNKICSIFYLSVWVMSMYNLLSLLRDLWTAIWDWSCDQPGIKFVFVEIFTCSVVKNPLRKVDQDDDIKIWFRKKITFYLVWFVNFVFNVITRPPRECWLLIQQNLFNWQNNFSPETLISSKLNVCNRKARTLKPSSFRSQLETKA